MEKTPTNLSPRLRGTKLDEWAKKWIDENLDEKQKLLYGDYVISRFKKGSTAFPIDATNKLYSIKDKIFPELPILILRITLLIIFIALIMKLNS